MENCNNGIAIPTTQTEECGGNYISTNCIASPNALTYLDLSAGASQAQINAALVTALLSRDEQITEIPVYDGSETKVIAGENVAVTGEGTTFSPYIVVATTVDSRPYKVYSAMMNQTGTGGLTVTNIMENTLGDIVWSREGPNLFYGRLDGAFVDDKTLCFANQGYLSFNRAAQPISLSQLTIDFIQVNFNDNIGWLSVEIKVYN